MTSPRILDKEDAVGVSSTYGYFRLRWLQVTGQVPRIARGASIEASVELHQRRSGQIQISSGAHIASQCWLNVPSAEDEVRLRIDEGTSIGRRNVISARNLVWIGANCVTAPNVLIMDHGHEYRDPSVPIVNQGMTDGGEVIIEPGCWIGFGVAIVCNRGVLRIGRNSVIGANSVVTRDVEPLTVVAGSPARALRRYHAERREWVRTAPDDDSRRDTEPRGAT